MYQIVHLVRHAQAPHNVDAAHINTRDPPLTPLGQEQCLDLKSRFPHHSSVDLLVTSPLCRTIQTTLSAFEPEVSRGVKCFALPELQEIGISPCSTGSGAFVISQAFKDSPINFDLVTDDWAGNKGKWAYEDKAHEARCQAFLRWVKSREEVEIVAITHGGLLHQLTTERSLCGHHHGPGWKNAEFRSYYIIDMIHGYLALQETAESSQRREEDSQPWGKAETQEQCARFRQQTKEDAALLKSAKEEKERRGEARRQENAALTKCADEQEEKRRERRREMRQAEREVDQHGGEDTEVTPKQAGTLTNLANDRRATGLPVWAVWIYLAAVLLVLLPHYSWPVGVGNTIM
ncbi:MAG: hypothetical protein Q9207_008542 [Kuettlingeria erythrocarpa]